MPLGAHDFKGAGRKESHSVTAVDGTPGIQVVVDGKRLWQPLERIQTKRRGKTIYGHWRIPELEAVSAHLQGLSTWIRHSSTDDERANGNRRTRALRTIPPTSICVHRCRRTWTAILRWGFQPELKEQV